MPVKPATVIVERTADVLLAFTRGEPALGVTELSSRLGLAKSVVHRTLNGLLPSGLIFQEERSGRYRLGPRALELGFAALGDTDIRSLAFPLMLSLRDETDETATLSLLSERERLYVTQVESMQDVRMTVELGRRFPLYAGASGRAMLAFLPEPEIAEYLQIVLRESLTPATLVGRAELERALEQTREFGYAASIGERDPWAASVAGPVHSQGRIVGSLSICGPRPRFTADRITELGPLARSAAETLSSQLAFAETRSSKLA